MKYYIAENGQQAGPFELNELLLHGLTVNSLVWYEGLPKWVSASQVPELMALLSGQTFNPTGKVSASQVPELMALLSGQTFNPTGIDTQLPQMPPMGEVQLPQVPPFGGQPQQPTQPTTYGQNTPNQPYAPPQYGPSTNQPNQMMPKNWLTESIVVTVITTLCCGAWFITLITGIIAIVQANGVKNKFNSGDYAGANKKAASARLWCLITAGIGIAAALFSAFQLIQHPELLQQIQEGAFGSLYGF